MILLFHSTQKIRPHAWDAQCAITANLNALNWKWIFRRCWRSCSRFVHWLTHYRFFSAPILDTWWVSLQMLCISIFPFFGFFFVLHLKFTFILLNDQDFEILKPILILQQLQSQRYSSCQIHSNFAIESNCAPLKILITHILRQPKCIKNVLFLTHIFLAEEKSKILEEKSKIEQKKSKSKKMKWKNDFKVIYSAVMPYNWRLIQNQLIQFDKFHLKLNAFS